MYGGGCPQKPQSPLMSHSRIAAPSFSVKQTLRQMALRNCYGGQSQVEPMLICSVWARGVWVREIQYPPETARTFLEQEWFS